MRPPRVFVLAAAALALGGCIGEIPRLPAVQLGSPPLATPGGPAPIKTDAQITNALVDLVQDKRRFKVDVSAVQPGTPLGDILSLGSPMGYQLRTRYLALGIPLSDALSRNADPVFRERLINLARWDTDGETRAAAMIALAWAHDAAHYDVFREALLHLDPAVRFGALEALLIWDNPQRALPLLSGVAEREVEPILRVYASGVMARLGDPGGLLRLRSFLDHYSWLVRAMAASYLGEYGEGADYDLLVSRIGRETVNDFVTAEYCIAALKLYSKRHPQGAPPAAPAPRAAPSLPALADAFQLEPLVVKARRSRDQPALDPQINQHLLRLLQQRMDARPDTQAARDASVGNLSKLSTATGYKLKTRYTELGFLLTEGLAGVTDMQLASELEKAVRLASNVQIRAAAMAALAYTHDLRYLPLFQGAIVDPNITVRFGALEALLLLNNPAAQFPVANAARVDQSVPLQAYAAAGMWRMGDIYGREMLLRLAQHQDWLVRAMSIKYLGDLGGADEYIKILQWFGFESHQMVKAEMCSALLNLQKFNEPANP
jgi:HEAT repeat protein